MQARTSAPAARPPAREPPAARGSASGPFSGARGARTGRGSSSSTGEAAVCSLLQELASDRAGKGTSHRMPCALLRDAHCVLGLPSCRLFLSRPPGPTAYRQRTLVATAPQAKGTPGIPGQPPAATQRRTTPRGLRRRALRAEPEDATTTALALTRTGSGGSLGWGRLQQLLLRPRVGRGYGGYGGRWAYQQWEPACEGAPQAGAGARSSDKERRAGGTRARTGGPEQGQGAGGVASSSLEGDALARLQQAPGAQDTASALNGSHPSLLQANGEVPGAATPTVPPSGASSSSQGGAETSGAEGPRAGRGGAKGEGVVRSGSVRSDQAEQLRGHSSEGGAAHAARDHGHRCGGRWRRGARRCGSWPRAASPASSPPTPSAPDPPNSFCRSGPPGTHRS